MNWHPEFERPLDWLVTRSLQAGVLVLLVLATQWIFHRRLSNRWRFALWWIVLARLLLPFSPQSGVSLFNLVRPAVQLAVLRQPAPALITQDHDHAPFSSPGRDHSLAENATSTAPILIPANLREHLQPTTVLVAPRLPLSVQGFIIPGLAAVWLAGVLILSGVVVAQWIRFNRELARASAPFRPEPQRLLDECRREFGVSRPIELLKTEAVQSPALCGLLRLRLLLPGGLGGQFAASELRYIFLHEMAHVKRGDLWLNWLVTALQILHWFNPLLWFGFARLRADRELACDELALLHAGDHTGTAYGETMVKLMECLSRPAAIPGLVGILEDKQQMRRRILMIVNFRRPSRWSALAVILIAAIAATALTDAQTNEPAGRRNQVESVEISPTPPLKLIFGEQINGVVLMPNGRPAPDAQVALLVQGYPIQLGEGEFTQVALTEPRPAHTAMDGSFTLPLYENAQSLVALNREGFAHVSLNQLAASPQITLQKWGRIAGTLRTGDRLGTNEVVTVGCGNTKNFDFHPPMLEPPLPLPWYAEERIQSRTDGQGRFVLAFVPPGRQNLYREIPDDDGGWMSCPLSSSSMEVLPGETTETNVRTRTVVGRLEFNGGLPNDLTNGIGFIIGANKTTSVGREFPVFDIRADGTFRAEYILPGTYKFRFVQYRQRLPDQNRFLSIEGRISLSRQKFSVPETKDPDDGSIVALGTVEVE